MLQIVPKRCAACKGRLPPMNTTDEFVSISPEILYFGTPVAVVSSLNPDGTTNLAAIVRTSSSARAVTAGSLSSKIPSGLVAPPHPLQRLRQGLLLHLALAVAGVECKHILVLISLVLEYGGHAMVGSDPVVHAVAHDVRIQ